MINKKKKRGQRKKKLYENEEDKQNMIDAENEIFEQARLEMMREESKALNNETGNQEEEEGNLNVENENKEENENENLKEDDKEKGDTKLNEKNLFIDNAGEVDINFD